MNPQNINAKQVEALQIQFENSILMNTQMTPNLQQLNARSVPHSLDKMNDLKLFFNRTHNQFKGSVQNQIRTIRERTEKQKLAYQNNLDEFELMKDKIQQSENEIEQIINQITEEINYNKDFKNRREEVIQKYYQLFDRKIKSYFKRKIAEHQNQRTKNQTSDYLCLQSVALYHQKATSNIHLNQVPKNIRALNPSFVKLIQMFKDDKEDLNLQIDNIKDDLSVLNQETANWSQYQTAKQKIHQLKDIKDKLKEQIKGRQQEKERLDEEMEHQTQLKSQQLLEKLLEKQSQQKQKMIEAFLKCSQLLKYSVNGIYNVEGQIVQ